MANIDDVMRKFGQDNPEESETRRTRKESGKAVSGGRDRDSFSDGNRDGDSFSNGNDAGGENFHCNDSDTGNGDFFSGSSGNRAGNFPSGGDSFPGAPQTDATPPYASARTLRHTQSEPAAEANSGVFDNRRTGAPMPRPVRPRRPPSRFWRDFTEGLPPLWGVDLVLVLITVAGLGWIAFHITSVLAFLAGLVYSLISAALTPVIEILLFLLVLALIAAALRRMCTPRGLC